MVFGGWEFNAGIDFLEFRPSEVAAAVAISVAREGKTVDTEKAISLLLQHVEKVFGFCGGPRTNIKTQLDINDDLCIVFACLLLIS